MQVNKISRGSVSNYMLSIMDPRFPAPIPDVQDFTTAIMKQVTLSRDLSVAGSGTLAFISAHHDVPSRVLVMAYGATAQVWSPLAWISFSENMSDNYSKARTVSGLLKIISATVTGNNFTVSGSAVGISYQDLPPFFAQGPGGISDPNNVTFGTLQSYARNPTCRQGLTRVADGVIALVHPEGLNEYVDVSDRGYMGSAFYPVGVTDVTRRYQSVSDWSQGPTSGWTTGPIAATTNVFESLNCVPTGARFVPANAMGTIQYDLYVRLVGITATVDVTVHLDVVTVGADAVTYEPTYSSITVASALNTVALGTNLTVPMSGTFNCESFDPTVPRMIQSIKVRVQIAGATVNVAAGRVAIEYLSLGDQFYQSPGTAVAVEGVSVGQVLAISGLLNYQAVPNANLARQIASDLTYVKSNEELLLAHMLVSNAAHIGLRFLYTSPEYEALLNEFPRLAETGNMKAISAGLLDGLRGFWRNWLAPTLKANLGNVLGSVGSFIRPDLGALGSTAGNALATLIPDYSGQASGLGRQMGYCMGLLVPPWEMADDAFVASLEGIVNNERLAIHQVARLLCYNHKTQNFEHLRLEATVNRILELGKRGVVTVVTVQGAHFVGKKEKLDLPSDILAWARRNTSFTRKQVEEAFGAEGLETFETMLRAMVFEKSGESYSLRK